MLRKNQKIILYAKLTEMIKRKIKYLVENKLWTATEIAAHINSHSSRISELKNGSRILSEPIFTQMIKSKFVFLSDIIFEISDNLNSKELKHLEMLYKKIKGA